MENDGEHVTGRRLDVNGGNLIYFRGTEPKGMYGNSKRNDQDMLEFVRTQEQKLKIEKLKWLENDAKIASLQKHPTGTTLPTKPTPVSKVLPKPKPNDIEIKKPLKERPNPKQIADVIDNRNKRASQWLHKEQQEYQAKKAEILEHKRAAKELDERRRAAKYAENERKKLKQFQILQEDPIVADMIPSDYEVEIGKSQCSLPIRTHISVVPVPESGIGTELRESDNTNIILQVANQLQLPEQPDNELLFINKRPSVPRLSKSYINKSNFGTVGGNLEVPTVTIDNNEQLNSPILKPRHQHNTKNSTCNIDSDDYDQDDFEIENPGQDTNLLSMNTSLVRKTLSNNRYSNTISREHKGSNNSDDDEQYSSDGLDEQKPISDVITQREAEETKQRRLIGNTYAKKRRLEQHRQEVENRRLKVLEEEKRLKALEELKNRVVSINKRTKHSSNNSTTTRIPTQQQLNSTPLVLNTLHSYATHTAGPTQTLIRALLSSPDVNLTETSQQILSSTDRIDSMTTTDQSNRLERVNLISSKSPERSFQSSDVQQPDPRYFDPENPTQWQEYLKEEELKQLHLEAKKMELIVKDADHLTTTATTTAITPPRQQNSMKSTSIPTSTQSRNSHSPSNQRATSTIAAGNQNNNEVKTARRPTPPPFRFSSHHPTTKTSTTSATTTTKPIGRANTIGREPTRSTTTTTATSSSKAKVTNKKTATTTGAPQQARTVPKRKPLLDNRRTTTAAGVGTTRQSRSRSAGSTGLTQRQRNATQNRVKSREERPPTRARSTSRSRSVLRGRDYDDYMGTDALDLFDRQYTHSSDDEVELGEEYPISRVSHRDSNSKPISSATSSQQGLGGYLSKSPARGFILSEDEYASTGRNLSQSVMHHNTVLQDVLLNRNHEEYRALQEQQLISDLSSQAISNFEQVTKTLHDVDKWCNIAQQESKQLQERLRVRDSVEVSSMKPTMSAGRGGLVEKGGSRAALPSQDLSFHSDTSFQHDPIERSLLRGSTVLSPPDERDIDALRVSLTGRLTSRAQELFADTSSGSSSAEESRQESQDGEDGHVTHNGNDHTIPVSQPTQGKVSNSVEEWRKQNEAIRAAHRAIIRPTPTIQRQPSQEESEDSVLMGEIVDSPYKATSLEENERSPYSDDETDSSDPIAEFEHKLSSLAPPRSSNTSNMILLNTNQSDRPIIWSSTANTSIQQQRTGAEVFSTGDPLLAQQLGMTADRNEILTRYGQLDMSTTQPERGSRKSITLPAGLGSPNRYQHSRNDDSDGDSNSVVVEEEDKVSHTEEEEDWTKPYERNAAPPKAVSTTASTRDASYKPSLRNVGELAGLLRKTYKAELETEAGRSAMLDTTDSDSDLGSDDSSEIGGDYNNYSAVSIMASRMIEKQAELLRQKECELEAKAQSSSGSGSTAATAIEKTTVSRSVDAPVAGELPSGTEDTEPFWAETLVKPEWQQPAVVEEGDEVNLEEFLHDQMMNLRYGVNNTEKGEDNLEIPIRPPLHTTSTAQDVPNTKIRYSGTEMRIRMMEELHKQDELFNYTLELAELEKTHAMQQARDLALQAQQRSSKELSLLQQRQETELQRIAYENSIALSVVSAQNLLDKQSSEQREQLLEMQTRLGSQILYKEYQELLHQADEVAGSLEYNQKLLEMEKLLHADKAREIVMNLESKHAIEKASMMVAHAEIQKTHAEALVEASRASMEFQRKSQTNMQAMATRISQEYKQHQPPLVSSHVLPTATSHPTYPISLEHSRHENYEEDFEDEYSEHFETDASMSVRSKNVSNKGMKTRFDISESESIPEDVEETAAELSVEVSDRERDHSLSATDSLTFSPPAKQWRQRPLHQSVDSIHSSVYSESAADRQSAGGRYSKPTTIGAEEESSADEVEDEVERSASMDEIAEESAFESYAETASPAVKAANRGSVAQSYSYSQSDRDFEISERSGRAGDTAAQSYSQSSRGSEVSEQSRKTPVRTDHSQSYTSHASDDFEVEDSANEDSNSIAEEVSEEEQGSAAEVIEEEGYDSYSDTFEGSGSRASKVASSITSSSAAATGSNGGRDKSSTKAHQTTLTSKTTTIPNIPTTTTNPRSRIPALETSNNSISPTATTAFNTTNIPTVLDEYRKEMEERLRGQEKTYKLKVQFIKAKQIQRLEWLEQVKKNQKIALNDIKEEEQRINDIYTEERAEIERERWSLNARAYKELRKFKRLRKDLLSFQINIQDSAKATAELEANLLNLHTIRSSHTTIDRKNLKSSRNKRQLIGNRDSSSVTSSSDSAAVFRNVPTTTTTLIAPSRVNTTRSIQSVDVDHHNIETKVSAEEQSGEDYYEGDDFEKTFSTAASSPVVKKGGLSAADSVSFSQIYETSAVSARHSEVPVHTEEKHVSDASEVSSEIAEEIEEEQLEDGEHSATYSEDEDDHQSPVQAVPKATTDTVESNLPESEYESEFEEPTLDTTAISTTVAAATGNVIDNTVHRGGESEEHRDRPEMNDSDDYEEDFAPESDQASEGRPGLSKPTLPVSVDTATHTPVPVVATTTPAVQEDEFEIESEVESEISAYGAASGSSDEPYYTSTSPTKEPHPQDLAVSEQQQPVSSPITTAVEAIEDDGEDYSEHSIDKTGDGEDYSEHLVDKTGDGEDYSEHLVDKTGDGQDYSEHSVDKTGDGEDYSEHSVDKTGLEEMAAESPVRVETAVLETSFRSGGSASVLEDEDEVIYGDDDFAEYESDQEAESLKQQDPSVDNPAAVAEALSSVCPVKAQSLAESDTEEQEVESIATSIEEEEGGVNEASDDQSEDYIATSRASLSLQPPGEITQADTQVAVAVETQGLSPLQDMPALDEASPLPASSSASSALSALSSPDKLTSLPGKDILNPKGEPDMEYWGSEDFLESPAVTELYRKTSEILLKQSSGSAHTGDDEDALSVDRAEGPNGMRFDPDQQLWIGGEEVSLGGFEESIQADNSGKLPISTQNSDDYAELDTSIEEEIPEHLRKQEEDGSMTSSDDEFVSQNHVEPVESAPKSHKDDIATSSSEVGSTHHSGQGEEDHEEEVDEYASDEFSVGEAEESGGDDAVSAAAVGGDASPQGEHLVEAGTGVTNLGSDGASTETPSKPTPTAVLEVSPTKSADESEIEEDYGSDEFSVGDAEDDQEESMRSSPEKAPVETADDQEDSMRSSPEKAPVETADDQEDSMRSSPEKAPVETADDQEILVVKEHTVAVEEIEEEIAEKLEESIAEDSVPPSDEENEDAPHTDSILETADDVQVEEPTIDTHRPNDSVVSAISVVQEDPLDDRKEELSADLSGLLAELQQEDDHATQSLSDDTLQLSAEYTEEGSLTDMTFDYVEVKLSIPSVSVHKPSVTVSAEDSLLDAVLDLSFDDEQKHDCSSSRSGTAGVLSSEGTEFAELSDVQTDFIETVIPVHDQISSQLEVSTESIEQATTQDDSESKKEQTAEEARLVLVEDVTESVLTDLLEKNIERVLAMIPEAVAHFSSTEYLSAHKDSVKPPSQSSPTSWVADAKSVSATTTTNVASTTTAATAKEDAALESSTDSKEEAALQEAAEHLAETILLHSSKFQRDHQSESKTAESKVAGDKDSKSSLPSLSSTRSCSSLPPVLEKPSRVSRESDDSDASSSGKVERPAEFGDDDEELYEFNIPTHKSSTTVVHALHGSEDPNLTSSTTNSSTKEESIATAAAIAAAKAIETVKIKCAEVVAETKAYVDDALLQPELYLAIKLADPNFTGRFIEGIPVIPEEEQEDAPPQSGLIHRAALNDRMNELCEEIYHARHHPTASLTLPLPKRLLLQALPLREDTLHAHILKNILQEQEEPLQLLLQQASNTTTAATTTDYNIHTDIPVQVDIIDVYQYEANKEIIQASNQMADALLARCIIELCADLGEFHDLNTIFH